MKCDYRKCKDKNNKSGFNHIYKYHSIGTAGFILKNIDGVYPEMKRKEDMMHLECYIKLCIENNL